MSVDTRQANSLVEDEIVEVNGLLKGRSNVVPPLVERVGFKMKSS